MNKIFKISLLFVSILTLTITISVAEGKSTESKCSDATKEMKCQAGKCAKDINKSKMKCQAGKCSSNATKVPTQGKCGQGKCG